MEGGAIITTIKAVEQRKFCQRKCIVFFHFKCSQHTGHFAEVAL